MKSNRKLRVIFVGDELKRFYPQINALNDQHEFFVEESGLCLEGALSVSNLSMIVFQKRVISDHCVECIKKIKSIIPQAVIVTLCEEIPKETLLNLFRHGVRDVLEQPFEKSIALERAINKISALFCNTPKNRERRYNYSSLRHLKEISINNNTDNTDNLNDDSRIERAKAYIEDNYRDPLALADIAGVACISKFHFCRIFKKTEGICFKDYLNNVRIEKAKELLKDKKISIAEVAFEVGFHSLSHFTSLFKNHLNISPGNFRRIAFKILSVALFCEDLEQILLSIC